MKLLGISFGRKGKSCDQITKQALMAARETGADVKFINTVNLTVGHCKSCAACIIGRDRGGQIKCAVKDDYQMLEEAILDADGVIIAAPVYALGPVGQLKNFIDRFGPAHDIAGAKNEQDKRKAEGKELLDERIFAKKWVGFVSVGGALTRNWTAMGIPNFRMFAASTCWNVVGQMDVWGMGGKGMPIFDEELMQQAADFGRHMAASLGKEDDELTWFGEEGVCPVCHNSMITVGKTTAIECPICGIRGKIAIENDEVKVTFSEEEQLRARGKWGGQLEHFNEINHMVGLSIEKIMAHKDDMPQLMAPYDNFEDTY